MNARGVATLAAVFFVLAVGYWLTGRVEWSRQQAAEQAKKQFEFTAADLDRVAVRHAGADEVVAERDAEGRWNIVMPHDYIPTAHPVWEQVASALAELSNERTVDEAPADLEVYGLAEPRLGLSASGSGLEPVSIAFGTLDPTQAHRYARLGDGPVFLTPREFFQQLDKPLSELRDRSVFTLGDAPIVRIEYTRHATKDADGNTRPAMTMRAFLDEAGVWRLSDGNQPLARQDRIAKVVDEVSLMRGRDYIDAPESLSDYGLDPPWAVLTIATGDGKAQTLEFGWVAPSESGASGGFFARRRNNPSVFLVDVYLLSLLPQEAGDFRERRLFTGAAKDLESITFSGERERFKLSFDPDSGWELVGPERVETDELEVSQYIAKLKVIEGMTFPPESEAQGLDPPRTSIEFRFRDGSPARVVEIGAPVEDSDPLQYYARLDDGTVTTVRYQPEVHTLLVSPFQFQKKEIFEFDPEDATVLELALDGTDYRFERQDGQWNLAQPTDRALSTQSDVAALLNLLASLAVTGVLKTTVPEDALGLGDPTFQATVTLGEGPEAIMHGPLRVGNRRDADSRERYITVGDPPGKTYFVDQGLLDDVRAVLQGLASRG